MSDLKDAAVAAAVIIIAVAGNQQNRRRRPRRFWVRPSLVRGRKKYSMAFEKEYPNERGPHQAILAAKEWVKNPCQETVDAAANTAAEVAWAGWAAAAADAAEAADAAVRAADGC